MENRNLNQNERNRKADNYIRCKACTKDVDEFRSYEGLITVVVTLLSLFSGLFIQLLIYNICNVRVREVPIILVVVLWVGFSAVVPHIINSLDL